MIITNVFFHSSNSRSRSTTELIQLSAKYIEQSILSSKQSTGTSNGSWLDKVCHTAK